MDLIRQLVAARGDRFMESRLIPELVNLSLPIRRTNHKGASPMPARFFEKIAYGMSDCWYWRGSRNYLGYGQLGQEKAHRVAWRLFNGDPGELMVLHKCDVRNCVNPDHLYLGTQLDNMQDCVKRGRHKNLPRPGASNGMATLTEAQVSAMREMRQRTGLAYNKIAKEFGISTMTAFRAITGQSWKTL